MLSSNSSKKRTNEFVFIMVKLQKPQIRSFLVWKNPHITTLPNLYKVFENDYNLKLKVMTLNHFILAGHKKENHVYWVAFLKKEPNLLHFYITGKKNPAASLFWAVRFSEQKKSRIKTSFQIPWSSLGYCFLFWVKRCVSWQNYLLTLNLLISGKEGRDWITAC